MVAIAAVTSSATEAVAVRTNFRASPECLTARSDATLAFIQMSIVGEEIDKVRTNMEYCTSKIKEVAGHWRPDYQLLGELQRRLAADASKLSKLLEQLEDWKAKYQDAQSRKGHLCPYGV